MKVFNKVDFDEWQEVADKCEYATFFHTPTWTKMFVDTYPDMEMAQMKFVFDDGTKVILPLVRVDVVKALYSKYISVVAGVYGGIIAEREVKKKELNRIFKYLLKKRALSFSLTGNPLLNYELPVEFKKKNDFTQILLLNKSEEELWASYKASVRKQIKKSKRARVIVRVANNFDEWKEYYSIYQGALKRWGQKATSFYPLSLFENIFKARNPGIKLWLVILDGKIVGGNLNFYHNFHCVEWHASFIDYYFKYGIRNFLIHNIILNAKIKKYKYYDFNPSGGHSGTVRFKEAFNPERVPVSRWEWESSIIKIFMRSKKMIKGLF